MQLMFAQHVFLMLFWLLFALFHSIFASEKWKKIAEIRMKANFKYYRVLYSFISSIILVVIVVFHFKINTLLLWKAGIFEVIIAIATLIVSACIMLYFAKQFFFYLSGADVFLKTEKTETLIRSSFYKYVRHPLYTATLVFVWSIFFIQPLLSNLISCICITVYTLIGIHFEEKKLVKAFGESYIQYRAKTPMLIPKLL